MAFVLLVRSSFFVSTLAAGLPEINGPFIAAYVSRVLHILGAIILAGGLFYMRAILAPSGPEACFANRRAVWARWVAVATVLLLVSGFYNYYVIVSAAKTPGSAGLPGEYHMLLGIKILLGLGVMFLAAILAGKTPLADRFRTKMVRWTDIAWKMVIAIVVIAALLRTFH